MRRLLIPFFLLLAFAGAALGQFQITTSSLPNGQVGSAYPPTGGFEQLQASGAGGPVRWAVLAGQLPPDFVLDQSATSTGGIICVGVLNTQTQTAICSGVAQSQDANTWNVTIQATDTKNPTNVTSRQFSLTVTGSNPPPSINSNQSLPVAFVGQAYSYQFLASGGTPPLRWSEFSASSFFPASFSLSSSGLLTSPQVTQADFAARTGGIYTFAVQVFDATNRASSAAQFNLTIMQGLTITNNSPLPQGVLGQSYQGGSGLQLQATGGTGSYLWAISSGSLPSGLSMSSGGFISGTPTSAVSQQQFTVQVTDIGSSFTSPPTTTKQFTMSVVSSAVSIVQTTLPVAFQNQAYSTTLTAQGGQSPYSWSLGANAITGLSIASSTGVLSGTPTNAPGTYSITVTVQDSANQTASFAFSLTIAANLTISTTSLPNGTSGQSYSATVNEAGGQGPYSWSVTAGSLPPGLTLQSSSGNSVTISGTPTTNGVFQFTIQVKDTGSRTATAALQIQIGPNVSITTTTLPDGSQGVTYNQNIVATGGQTPYTWTIASGTLPAGLSQTTSSDTTMLIINGTPSGQGSQFTVQVKDAQGNTAQQSFSINVGVPLVITTVTVPNGTVGVAYSLPLGANGGAPPFTWSVLNGTLPGGLTLNSSNGLLSGTPATAGNYSFTVQVKDVSGATAQRAFTIAIISQLSMTGANFSGQVGTPFSQALSATGGVPPYTFAIKSGSLPTGINFNGSNGSFSGTPTVAGNSSLVVVVSDSSGANASATVSFSISLNTPPPLSIASIAPTPGAQPALVVTLGAPFSVDLTGTMVLTFASSVGGDDQTVGFTAIGPDGTNRSASFTIPAGRTAAVFSPATLAVRTGTVAGTITLRVTKLLAAPANTDVTPNPATQTQIVIAPSGPVLTAMTCAATSGGFTVSITGFTTPRNMVSGTFNFTAPSGSTIQSGSNTVVVQLATPFNTWFATATSNATGGQFLLTMPFTTTGQTSAAGIGVSAALGNTVTGSNSLSATCQ